MKIFFDFGGCLIGIIKKIKLFLVISIDFVIITWVSQIFIMPDSRYMVYRRMYFVFTLIARNMDSGAVITKRKYEKPISTPAHIPNPSSTWFFASSSFKNIKNKNEI